MSWRKQHPIPGLGSSSEDSENDEGPAAQSADGVIVDPATPEACSEEVIVTTEDEDYAEPSAEFELDQTQEDQEEEAEYDPMDAPFLIRPQQKPGTFSQAGASGTSDLDSTDPQAGDEPTTEEPEEMEVARGDDDEEEAEHNFVIDVHGRCVRIMRGKYSENNYTTLEKISAETLASITERVHSPNVDDDDHFYCELCVKSFRVCCMEHPLYRIMDRPIKKADGMIEKGPVDDRAKKTLPAFIKIRPSSIRGAGLGAFCNVELPVGIVFGPYQGILSNDKNDRGYSWEIRNVNALSVYLDGSDARYSNWMRYINSPRNDREQNLLAFQYNGSVFYRVIKPIDADQELLVWYGATYGESLGVFSTKRARSSRSSSHADPAKNPFIM